MIKKIFILLLSLSFFAIPCFAEKIPVKITSIQLISTYDHDIEVGDLINFIVVKDVSINNKLYIAKNTRISGIVDFVHPNGWAGDRAEIWIKNFHVKTVDNKNIEIDYSVKILKTPQDCKHLKDYFVYYFLGSIRGSEIYIEPNAKIYNIFIER